MKKILASIFAASLSLGMVSTTASAATGWQDIGDHKINIAHNWQASSSQSGIIKSGGGNLKVCGSADNRGATTKVILDEMDGSTPTRVKTVSSHNFYNSCLTFKDLTKYVDGTNKKAEFRLSMERTDPFQSAKTVNFTIYD